MRIRVGGGGVSRDDTDSRLSKDEDSEENDPFFVLGEGQNHISSESSVNSFPGGGVAPNDEEEDADEVLEDGLED